VHEESFRNAANHDCAGQVTEGTVAFVSQGSVQFRQDAIVHDARAMERAGEIGSDRVRIAPHQERNEPHISWFMSEIIPQVFARISTASAAIAEKPKEKPI
jgi:hypothetical protein